jgi:hypothetical protein
MLDGNIVESNYNVPGPVRSVGPEGIAIGHWAAPPNILLPGFSTFEGHMGELQLYVDDPNKDQEQILDPCCIDRAALDNVVGRLRDAGWDGDRLTKYVTDLVSIATQITAAIRGGDAAETEKQKQLTLAMVGALLRKDTPGLRYARKQMTDQISTRLTADQLATFSKSFLDVASSLPLTPADWFGIAKALCLDYAVFRAPTPGS